MDSRREEMFLGIEEILSNMVKIPTVSGAGNESQYCIEEYKEYLKKTFSVLFQKAQIIPVGSALILYLKGTDRDIKPVLFTGHMDVVPAIDEQAWKYPPFSGNIAEKSVWGRGTQDMKGPQCALLSAFERVLKEKKQLKRDIYLYLSCDEETGGDTTKKAALWFKDKGVSFQTVFDEGGTICENFMGIVQEKAALIGIAEKGSLTYEFISKGEGGHAANPPANSAIAKLAEFIHYVENTDIFYRELTKGNKEMLKAISQYAKGDKRELIMKAAKETQEYPILCSLFKEAKTLLGATIAFTVVHGGTAVNVMPKEIRLTANVRVSAVQTEQEVTRLLKRTAEKFQLECKFLGGADASEETEIESWGFQTVERCIHTVYPEMPVIPFVLGGGTDSRHFQNLTREIIRFSPLYASGNQGKGVHGDNESVFCEEVRKAAACYYELLTNGI